MKIYPKDVIEVDTTLSAAEIFSALEAEVEPPKSFRWWSESEKKFQGEFSYSYFKIWRIISYRNSFLPIIEGKINPTTSGTCVIITMRLHRFVAAFMLFWLGGVSTGAITFLIEVMRGKTEPLPMLLGPLVMLVF